MLYQPTHVMYLNPSRINLHPELIRFPSEDGTGLTGWYFSSHPRHPAAPPKGLIVFFHGNAQNMTSHYLNLAWLLKDGYDLFIFDYRGYGLSKGKPSPQGTLEDGHAAVRWAYERCRKKYGGRWKNVPIVIYGQSLGGAVALRTAYDLKKEIPIRLIVAESTFASYRAAARSVLSHFWLTWIFQPVTYLVLSDQYAPGDRVAKLTPIPLVVIHGDQDPVIDFDLGRELYKDASNPKEFWEVPGGHHIDAMSRKDPTFRKKLVAKLDQLCLKGKPASKQK